MIEKIEKYRKILRIQDWDIDYVEIPTLNVNAQTKLIYNDYKAVIEMKSELSDTEKEFTLIHELLHLIFRDAYDIFSEQCNDEFAKSYCEKQHERAIEKTAKIIYHIVNKEGEPNA